MGTPHRRRPLSRRGVRADASPLEIAFPVGAAPMDGWMVFRTVVRSFLGSYLFLRLLAITITCVVVAIWMRFSTRD